MSGERAGAASAGALVTLGAGWFSLGAGLVVAGLCVAVFTALFLVEFGGGDG